ncbi:hypothetical protein [Novosphingobium sediminicola]|uniref:Uncharacterized protein n=1 Tax=Novosphingobium sediminicola TaxID=563162 RepID=A0A7W6CF39_9SPHN|nr:hypothetical protein [Novosphingobium sediminicola]MBB3954315.1 hypothetical protein [Novosphingobium sediminicola]
MIVEFSIRHASAGACVVLLHTLSRVGKLIAHCVKWIRLDQNQPIYIIIEQQIGEDGSHPAMVVYGLQSHAPKSHEAIRSKPRNKNDDISGGIVS